MRRLFLLVVLSGLTPQFAAAQEDAVQRGEAAFRMCGACHSVGENAVNRIGPELNGVMGVPVATRPGFSYSESLSKLSADGDPEWLVRSLPEDGYPPQIHEVATDADGDVYVSGTNDLILAAAACRR